MRINNGETDPIVSFTPTEAEFTMRELYDKASTFFGASQDLYATASQILKVRKSLCRQHNGSHIVRYASVHPPVTAIEYFGRIDLLQAEHAYATDGAGVEQHVIDVPFNITVLAFTGRIATEVASFEQEKLSNFPTYIKVREMEHEPSANDPWAAERAHRQNQILYAQSFRHWQTALAIGCTIQQHFAG